MAHAIKPQDISEKAIALSSVYHNPFDRAVSLESSLLQHDVVKLDIHDGMWHRVRTLVNACHRPVPTVLCGTLNL